MDASKLFRDATQHAEAGHFGRAAELFAKASEQDPRNARPHEARAQCLLELEAFEEALSAAELAAQLDRHWLPAQATLGRAQLNAGHLQDAVASFSEALHLAEQDKEWQSDLKLELREAKALLEKHWAEHHDVLLPVGMTHLRIRQALDCRYCHMAGELGPGGALWAAGAVLALHPAAKEFPADDVSKCGRRILELGSGTGAAGLAFAASGAQVLLTDRDSLLPLLRLNAELNHHLLLSSGGAVQIGVFDWLTPPEEILRQTFDLVIGADLVYSFAAVEPFIIAVTALLQEKDGKRVASRMIYAHFPRFPKLDDEMCQALARQGFLAKVMPGNPHELGKIGRIPQGTLDRVQLLEIRPFQHGEERRPLVLGQVRESCGCDSQLCLGQTAYATNRGVTESSQVLKDTMKELPNQLIIRSIL
ncbi:unnamed protein product [Durusdinium trenchii]|uniref:Uncharacterized protein n=1 Tax=Durusdinium trenchii TaxID=1381693 RepID=A0ABP0LGU7_9DINO